MPKIAEKLIKRGRMKVLKSESRTGNISFRRWAGVIFSIVTSLYRGEWESYKKGVGGGEVN